MKKLRYWTFDRSAEFGAEILAQKLVLSSYCLITRKRRCLSREIGVLTDMNATI